MGELVFRPPVTQQSEFCVHRGEGDVILGGVRGVAAVGLCLDDRRGEQVVALRSRSVIKTEGVSLYSPPSCRTLPSLAFFLHLFITEYLE